MESLSNKLEMWLERSPGDGSGMFFFKKGTEGLILAANEQGLRTTLVKHSIEKTSETPLSRLCRDSTETVWHIVSGCRELAQRKWVHWELCRSMI